MKQYCRYCTHCCYGDEVYCQIKDKTMSEKSAKRPNECKSFVFNEIDVFDANHKYNPKEYKQNKQLKLF